MAKFIKSIIIFGIIFLMFNHTVAYIYEKPMRQAIRNKTHMKYLKWTDIKNEKNEYDLIFLGSSRGYCAYNPIVVDSLTKYTSYNMCTGNQDIIQSYFILKELLKYQQPEYIIYEMFLPSFPSQTDYYPVFSNALFMSIEGKMDMILNGYGMGGLLSYIFPLFMHKNYIRKDIISFVFKGKEGGNALLQQKQTKWVKGFCYNEMIVDSTTISNFSEIYSFSNINVSNEKIDYYFHKFSELCKQNNINLICVRSPYPPSRLEKSTIDTAGIYFKNKCTVKDIPFFDFNYQSNDKYKYFDQDFADYHHMNYLGAQNVSAQLSEILVKLGKR